MSDAQPITGCRPGDIAEHAFVCGDPARVDRITSRWDSRSEVANIREYTIVTGEKNGVALDRRLPRHRRARNRRLGRRDDQARSDNDSPNRQLRRTSIRNSKSATSRSRRAACATTGRARPTSCLNTRRSPTGRVVSASSRGSQVPRCSRAHGRDLVDGRFLCAQCGGRPQRDT